MATILPIINSEGTFTLKVPFNTLINEEKSYKVISIRNIQEMIDGGVDLLNNIYVPVGLQESDLLEDLNTGISIVTVVDDGGRYVYFPSDAILTHPNTAGILYNGFGLAINLGELPSDYDFSLLESSITDLIKGVVGINPSISTLVTSARTVKTFDEDDSLTTLRENYTSVYETYETRYNKLIVQYNETTDTLQKLEEYVVQLLNNQP